MGIKQQNAKIQAIQEIGQQSDDPIENNKKIDERTLEIFQQSLRRGWMNDSQFKLIFDKSWADCHDFGCSENFEEWFEENVDFIENVNSVG